MDINIILQSVVLGIVQGLTEFIPVSSSGNLYLIPQSLGWQVPSTVYILALHLGTLLALIVYYRQLILSLLKAGITLLRDKGYSTVKETRLLQKQLLLLVTATIPAGAIGLAAEKLISGFYDNPDGTLPINLTIASLAIVGIVFILSERLFTGKKHGPEKLSWGGALFIGFSQVLAFVRGVSRSGITLISGQLSGMSKVAAAEFSFLMSIPLLIGTSIYGLVKLSQLPVSELNNELGVSAIGLVAAFLSGLFAIGFMLKHLKRHSLSPFGWFRLAAAAAFFLLLS